MNEPPAAPHPYGRIVIALDGSRTAEQSLPYVEALATKFGSTVTLVRAVMAVESIVMLEHAAEAESGAAEAGLPAADAESDVTEAGSIDQVTRSDASRYLRAVQRRLEEHGINADFECPEGRYAEAVVGCAGDLGADLIAMTTHGYSGVQRAILGSVADKVVRHAPCPVLLIRAR